MFNEHSSPTKKKLDLEIIIVTFNSQFWLRKTLETLDEYYLQRTKKNVLVTVVDNNSEDDSIKMMRKEFDWVNLVQLPENVGYSAANNKALQETRAEYVMLLNSDVECTDLSNIDVLIKKIFFHR